MLSECIEFLYKGTVNTTLHTGFKTNKTLHFSAAIHCVLILLISTSAPDDGSVLLPKHIVFY
jgi:hypothetical protein